MTAAETDTGADTAAKGGLSDATPGGDGTESASLGTLTRETAAFRCALTTLTVDVLAHAPAAGERTAYVHDPDSAEGVHRVRLDPAGVGTLIRHATRVTPVESWRTPAWVDL